MPVETIYHLVQAISRTISNRSRTVIVARSLRKTLSKGNNSQLYVPYNLYNCPNGFRLKQQKRTADGWVYRSRAELSVWNDTAGERPWVNARQTGTAVAASSFTPASKRRGWPHGDECGSGASRGRGKARQRGEAHFAGALRHRYRPKDSLRLLAASRLEWQGETRQEEVVVPALPDR